MHTDFCYNVMPRFFFKKKKAAFPMNYSFFWGCNTIIVNSLLLKLEMQSRFSCSLALQPKAKCMHCKITYLNNRDVFFSFIHLLSKYNSLHETYLKLNVKNRSNAFKSRSMQKRYTWVAAMISHITFQRW